MDEAISTQKKKVIAEGGADTDDYTTDKTDEGHRPEQVRQFFETHAGQDISLK